MIPKLIHQIWVGPRPMPGQWMETWKAFHPSWDYMLWTDKVVSAHMRHFPTAKHITQFLLEGKYHGVSDLLRNEIIQMYGGFVAPADSEALRPLDSLIDELNVAQTDSWTCEEADLSVLRSIGAPSHEDLTDLVLPLLGGRTGSRFARYASNALAEVPSLAGTEPWRTTGNQFVAKLIARFKVEEPMVSVLIMPWWSFVPKHRTGYEYAGTEPVYCYQHFGTTNGLYEKLAEGKLDPIPEKWRHQV